MGITLWENIVWVWDTFCFHYEPASAGNYFKMVRSYFKACGFKRNAAEALEFLDRMEMEVQAILFGKEVGKRKFWRRFFLKALKNPVAKREIVAFLIKKTAFQDSWNLEKKLFAIMKDEPEGMPAGRKTDVTSRQMIGTPVEELVGMPGRREVSEPAIMAEGFYAKTYLIATHLYFELADKESEYDSLIRKKTELEAFIREKFVDGKFNLVKLPGTLFDKKDYSYKKILAGKNSNQKGQLKPSFRQIIENPQIFGEEISNRARAIFNEHFTE
jgi:hypothetical protein